jgi:hypothetical protein
MAKNMRKWGVILGQREIERSIRDIGKKNWIVDRLGENEGE